MASEVVCVSILVDALGEKVGAKEIVRSTPGNAEHPAHS